MLGGLVQLHARCKFRQVVVNLVVSELSSGPAACVGTLLNSLGACEDSVIPASSVTGELQRLGVSTLSIEKVLQAFDSDVNGYIAYGRFAAGCGDLAEDRLDHALWRVFTAVGEEHRGILGASEMELVLSGRAGHGGEWACGAEHYIRGAVDPELTATEIVRLVAKGGDKTPLRH